jgi:2-polyprenyl-3-methyl-5-hydroxy-6-metoxy-1,4-benzoquinol methylase
MYITKVFDGKGQEGFDWEAYFSQQSRDETEIIKIMDLENTVKNLRMHLREDMPLMVFTLGKMMFKLMEGFDFKKPEILELGAATGFLTKWLLEQMGGGSGVLVDKSEASHKAFLSKGGYLTSSITYLSEDVFTLNLEKKFDIVCSFGLIEHFRDKAAIIDVHKKFVKDSGIIIILVPLNTPLSRAFFEVHPEMNLGYRELLTTKELYNCLSQYQLEVVRTQESHGYTYDYLGALCKKMTP